MEKKIRYQRGYVARADKSREGKATGSLELWVNSVDAPATGANGKRYVRLSCSGTFAKSSGIPYALGDVQNENNTLFVRVTVFEPLCDSVIKMGLSKGSRAQFYGNFEVSEYNGKKYVDCIAQRVEKKWPLAEGKGEQFGGYLSRVNNEPGVGRGSLAMYLVKPMEVKKPASGNEVGELRLSGRFQNSNGVAYALGDDILNPKDGHMFVSATAWSYALESLKRLNLKKGALIQVYGDFEVRTYPRNDGSTGKEVVCRDIHKFDVLSYGSDDNDGGAATSAATPAATAPAAQTNVGGFQTPDHFGGVVVPF